MRKLAIVILNWNGCDMMRQYLPSVLENSEGDVVVADNASSDGSLQMLEREFPDVHTIVLDRNYGFAEGYNRALAQLTEYEYFLLLNSDVEIRQRGWDKVLTDYMDEHPDCAACQPKLLDLKRPTHFEYAGAAGGFIDRYGYPFCRGRVLGVTEEDGGQYDNVCDVMWATGAALLCRAKDWRQCGGLDSRFFAHMEEIDLCWRLRNMGKRIACVPQSTAYHLGGATLNQGNPHKTFLNFRNNRYMLHKNLPAGSLRRTLFMRTLLDWLAALQFLIKGDMGNAKAVIKAWQSPMPAEGKGLAEKNSYKSFMDNMGKGISTSESCSLMPYSILWQYYVRGKRTFSQLTGL